MFDIRSPLIAWAAPAGLALAALVWIAFHAASYFGSVEGLETRLAASPRYDAQAAAPFDPGLVGRLVNAPLFTLTAGPGAVPEPKIKLQGLALTPNGQRALLMVNDKPAGWLVLGATRDGVTVMAIDRDSVTLDTATGFKTVGLTDATSSASGQSPASGGHAPSTSAGAPAEK